MEGFGESASKIMDVPLSHPLTGLMTFGRHLDQDTGDDNNSDSA
jgi:hypothetical protein